MSRYLQTLSALLLVLLVSVFGQSGIRQCLCTGQVNFAAEAVDETGCGSCDDECPLHDELPSPCEDEFCWMLITLDAVECAVAHVPTHSPVAICSQQFANSDLRSPRVSGEVKFSQCHPPDRCDVSLTVLYSSFLI
ncbi:MAG: hypothetical protein ACI8XO_002314 [Verrucomicrobiales bacterium]|jgi:hypothetical protein